jgi:hypothetical protein
MLRITIELVPYGDESKKEVIGIATIANDATGDQTTGNYKYHISKWGKGNAMWKAGKLAGFPRKRLGPWDLLFRVLSDAVGKRNT